MKLTSLSFDVRDSVSVYLQGRPTLQRPSDRSKTDLVCPVVVLEPVEVLVERVLVELGLSHRQLVKRGAVLQRRTTQTGMSVHAHFASPLVASRVVLGISNLPWERDSP